MEFDAKTLKRLEALYATRDARQPRQAVLDGLALKPGERVLDIGKGAGFLAAEMADAVGAAGNVLGLDRSSAMLAVARVRCAGKPWVELREADAVHLPLPDAVVDVAVSVQVLEYVRDARAALAEIRRTLRPGGGVAIIATDWDAVVWVSSDAERMRKMLRAFDSRCAFSSLPRTHRPDAARGGVQP